jgi:hypothetical protein
MISAMKDTWYLEINKRGERFLVPFVIFVSFVASCLVPVAQVFGN